MKTASKYLIGAMVLGMLGGHTASAGTFSVIGKLGRDYTVSPGMSIVGRIIVKNPSVEPVEVEARLADYIFQADGTNNFVEPGTLPRSNASWVTISPQQLVIPPNETLSFSYRIDVPDDPDLEGSYWSIVLISPVVKPYAVESEEGKTVVGIQSVLQYGVQLATHFSGTGSREMKVLESHLVEVDGEPQLELQVASTGTLMIRPRMWVELFDEEGASSGRFEGTSMRAYPGCSVRVQIPLSGVSAGSYTALLVADLGNDDLVGMRYQLEIDDGTGG